MYGKSAMEYAAKDLAWLIEAAQANMKVLPGPVVNVQGFGAKGGLNDDSEAIQAAVNYAVENGIGTLFIPFSSITLKTDVDCKQLRILGNKTSVSGNLENSSHFEGVIFRGFDYEDFQLDPMVAASSSGPKYFRRESNNTYYLITSKMGGKGYLFYWLESGITASANASNYGPPGELLRVTLVWNLIDAIVYKHGYSAVNGTWTEVNHNYYTAAGGRAVKFWNNTTKAVGDYIEFSVNVQESGKFNLSFLMTAASSNNVELRIDGSLVETLDLTNATNAIWVKEYSAKPGTRLIRLTNNAASRGFYVSGYNYYKLKDADVNREYDDYAYWRDDNHYISNKGALDYAIQESETGKLCGSYHGGETLISRKIIADGYEISLSTGQMAVLRNLSIEQTTNIISKLTATISQRFNGDGVFEISGQFSGDINVDILYTAMTTTDSSFDEIDYPIRKTVGTETYIYMGRRNKIVQRKESTNQKITSMFTLYNQDNNTLGGMFMNPVEGGYNKVYYGKVRGSFQNIKDIAFTSVRIFE